MLYRAYGLVIESDTPLPELPSLGGGALREADLKVALRAWRCEPPRAEEILYSRASPKGEPWLRVARTQRGYYLLSEAGIADFLVDPTGREIKCCRVEIGTDEVAVRHALLDWVLPLVLNLQGKQPLHASSVLTPEGLLAFVGPSGSGKSTTAAALMTEGYPVVADDCLLLNKHLETGAYIGVPAYPSLRLWDDSIEALGLVKVDEPALAKNIPKRRITPFSEHDGTRTPSYQLKCLYLLSRDRYHEEHLPRLETITGREALIRLLNCAWILDPTDKVALVRRFRFFADVVQKVETKSLHLCSDLNLLPEVRRLVLADIGRLPAIELQKTCSPHSP